MKFSADKLKQAMKAQEVSLRMLGRTLGRSYQTINSWTLGDSVPSSNDLPNLAVALDKNVSYFFEAEGVEDARSAPTDASHGPSGSPPED